MKKLIIILALIGLTFLALLIYGANRSDQPKRPCENPKGFSSNSDPDEDDLEGWCPPSFAEKTKPLQARFAPALGLDPPEKLRGSTGRDENYIVVPSDKKVRSARITLVEGQFAILAGPEDGKLCLCRPGLPMNNKLFEGEVCPQEWKKDHSNRVCQSGDKKGMLPFREPGGAVILRAGPQAMVSIE